MRQLATVSPHEQTPSPQLEPVPATHWPNAHMSPPVHGWPSSQAMPSVRVVALQLLAAQRDYVHWSADEHPVSPLLAHPPDAVQLPLPDQSTRRIDPVVDSPVRMRLL